MLDSPLNIFDARRERWDVVRVQKLLRIDSLQRILKSF
jgi:hypothetical protein